MTFCPENSISEKFTFLFAQNNEIFEIQLLHSNKYFNWIMKATSAYAVHSFETKENIYLDKVVVDMKCFRLNLKN